ncbi:UDP-N-acetylmuramate dehydrogenase [Desulfosarcina sp. BuS5]|uniref:UDP-N-acetylmuramate dehydrogenase n=1 Tax=Desulfosarcina sp. BuS5 TaxID=933262 RepID=UPI0006855664|nr:UDP-N-acetylmuramate dehydrogenase [Desulfosarcina sp. BuS5]WDN88103.1 UDP-N-acetylmuramate dehydrogenase [Desulfosarcina sp. BuS5]
MMINHAAKEFLKNISGGNVRFDEPMSRHTSLRVGGTADFFAEPDSLEALVDIVKWTSAKSIPYLIIGGGSNLLVRDNGIRGLVISLKKCLNCITDNRRNDIFVEVSAGAGVNLQRLCFFAMNKGLEGMNFALGIPGSVGGAIVMNAGTEHGFMEKVLDSVNVLMTDGKIEKIDKTNIDFSYRELALKLEQNKGAVNRSSNRSSNRSIIISGKFLFTRNEPAKLKKEAESMLGARNRKQPTNLPSAGCFFRNPQSGMTAGELIDRAGLKGKIVGGARISMKHANFIINRDNASAADIIALMEEAQERVDKHFNIFLEPEVKIVGE